MSKKHKMHNTSADNSNYNKYSASNSTQNAVDGNTKSPNDVQASKNYKDCK